MATVEKNVYQGLSLELLLEQKIAHFFESDQYQISIFHAYATNQKLVIQKVEAIEVLIPIIRESIATSQMKRALKQLVTLDVLMAQVLEQQVIKS